MRPVDQVETAKLEYCPVCNETFDSHDNLNSPCINKTLFICVSELSAAVKAAASSEDITRIQESVSNNLEAICTKLNSTQMIRSSHIDDHENEGTLETRIKEAAKSWNRNRKLISALKKQPLDNAELKFFHVFHEAVSEQRFWRHYLRRRFRFDVKRLRWLRNLPADFGVIERNAWTYARNRYFIFYSRHYRGTRAFATSFLQGNSIEDAYKDALIAMQRAVYEAFYAIAVAAVAMPWPEQRDVFLPELSGYVKAQIKQYPRLKRALGKSLYLDQLPGSVFLALQGSSSDKFPPITGPGSLVNAVVRLLETETAHSQKDIEDSAQTREIVAQEFERFVLQEEARLELDNLKTKAGLSGRETQVLELKLQDCTEDDIASRLGIAQGAVKALWSRARGKLKKAAGNQF